MSEKHVPIYPSVMCCKPWELKEYLEEFEKAGIAGIHFDVMDGHYVPNVMLGTDDFNAIREVTNIPIDVHFMCTDPERFFTYFNWKENDRLSFHPETAKQPYRLLMAIREKGMKAGYAMSPGIPYGYVKEALPFLDFIMFMGVNPGFAGQKLIPNAYEKIRRMRELLDTADHKIELVIDGNTTPEHARKMLEAGADGLVTGTSSMLKLGPKAFEKCYNDYVAYVSAE